MVIRCIARVQIEFYFSDSNLPRDVFMAERIAEDPEVWSLPTAGIRYSENAFYQHDEGVLSSDTPDVDKHLPHRALWISPSCAHSSA